MADDRLAPSAPSVPFPSRPSEMTPEADPEYLVKKVNKPRTPALQGSRLVREHARMFLAYSFAFAFVGTLGGSFFGAVSGHWAEVRDWLHLVLPAETGLFGSALGFYFGSHRS